MSLFLTTMDTQYSDTDGQFVPDGLKVFEIKKITSAEVFVHCDEWNWTFTFDRSTGEMTNGLEMADRFDDDGADLSEWALEAANSGGES